MDMDNSKEELQSLNSKILSEIKFLEESEIRMNKIADMTNLILAKLSENIENINTQDRTLQNIQLSGDLRKRESENSVREIKSQISDMDRDMDGRFAVLNQNVVQEIRRVTEIYDRNLTTSTDILLHKIRILESRVNDLEQWRFYFTLGAVLAGMLLSMPDLITILR